MEDKYVNDMDWAEGDKGFSLFNNYRNYQFNAIEKYIGKHILEIGSGDRSFSNQLLLNCDHEYDVLSIEPSKTLFNLASKSGPFPNNFSFQSMDLFEMKEQFNKSFDTILMIHVLEHIEHDREAIIHLHSLLDDNGYFLIQVPAYQWLYSEHDRSLGHFKRYNKESIKSIVDPSKFKIVKMFYQDPIGVLGSLYFFKIKKTKLKSSDGENLINKQGQFYNDFIIPFEQFIEKYITFPFGLNLTVILKKI